MNTREDYVICIDASGLTQEKLSEFIAAMRQKWFDEIRLVELDGLEYEVCGETFSGFQAGSLGPTRRMFHVKAAHRNKAQA